MSGSGPHGGGGGAATALSATGAALALLLFLAQAPAMRAMLVRGAAAPSELPAQLQSLACALWAAWGGLALAGPQPQPHSLAVLLVSVAGLLINAGYAAAFVAAAPAGERARTAARFTAPAVAAAGVALLLAARDGFALPLAPATAAALASCAVAASTAMFAAPLVACVSAVHHQRADRLPAALLAASLACAACFTAAGMLAADPFVIVPSTAGVVLSGGQLLALPFIRLRLARAEAARRRAEAPPAPQRVELALATLDIKSHRVVPPLPANTAAAALPDAPSSTSLDGLLLTPSASEADVRALLRASAATATAAAAAAATSAAASARFSSASTVAAHASATDLLAANGDVTPAYDGTPSDGGSPTHEHAVGFDINEADEEEARAAAQRQRRDAAAVAAALSRLLAAPSAATAAALPSHIAALAARIAADHV